MLILATPDGQERFEFPDDADVVTIGRVEGNPIVVDNPHVSALHGQITRRQGRYYFQDLQSTNGSAVHRGDEKTMLDGETVSEIALQEGDLILLGHEQEPAVLVVEVCRAPGEQPLRGATMVATHQMKTVGAVSQKIESSGGTLVPFLALAERLSSASSSGEAEIEFHDCIRQVMPSVRDITLVDSPPDEPDISELTVLEVEGTPGKIARIPIDLGPEANRLALLKSGDAGFSVTELDSCSLAVTLLSARLRQLGLVAQLESARARLTTKNRYLREKAEERATGTMIGQSPAMQTLQEEIRKVALADATVLITGQSGSGKELVAREIHRLSLRHNEIFAAVNCGALVESLLESELFGCRKGAFTGATRDREGLFEVAHGGTLFLDEIGDMSPALQVKLLRVLETGEVTPVGGTRTRKVDVRVITATNRDLQAAVEDGSFREDLFYRIHVFPIQVPPLAKRRSDIQLLARHFLTVYAEKTGATVTGISDQALRLLATREYPGNVRQLSNEIQRAVLLAADCQTLEPEHLESPDDAGASRAIRKVADGTLKIQMAAVEKVLIEEALANHKGNRTHAAKELGITRQALLVKLNKYGLSQEKK